LALTGSCCAFWNTLYVVCTTVAVEPGVLLVNPVRPCLKINDVPVGWEYFSQRGWDVFEVPPPVTISGRFCNSIRISAVIINNKTTTTTLHYFPAFSWVLSLWLAGWLVVSRV